MKIEHLIEFYEIVLKDERRFFYPGLCSLVFDYHYELHKLTATRKSQLLLLFCKDNDEYYKNYFTCGAFLFTPNDWTKRDAFMKDEIKSLKKLLKQGYTHI